MAKKTILAGKSLPTENRLIQELKEFNSTNMVNNSHFTTLKMHENEKK
jgi:hypothetical protein